MVMITIERLDQGSEIPPDIPGKRVTVNLHQLPANVQTLQGLLDYVLEKPHVLPAKLIAILELYRARPIAPKPA